VELRLDLNRMARLLEADAETGETTHVESFKSAFLHELGHVLFSLEMGEAGALLDDSRVERLAGRAPARTLEELGRPEIRHLLEGIGEILEDARVERLLMESFRGAGRYLHAHAQAALEVARGSAPEDGLLGALEGRPQGRMLARLVAALYLELRGLGGDLGPDEVPRSLARTISRLRAPLLDIADPAGLVDWLVLDLLPELIESFPEMLAETAVRQGDQASGSAETQRIALPDDRQTRASGPSEESPGTVRSGRFETPGEAAPPEGGGTGPGRTPRAADMEDVLEQMRRTLGSQGLLGTRARHQSTLDRGSASGVESLIILYPHIDGSSVIDDVSLALAHRTPPTPQCRQVLQDVSERYGPLALEAFAGEAAALRRAFQVNYERRFIGRYRSGRRVGMPNLRRYTVNRDTRLFQRMEVPDRLSYYFHLLIDVSPSMLTDRNAAKAIAVGYAFAEALDRLRVPVDVSLYSAAITRLYDHRRDSLDRFFGGSFGYLSSGTHEIEAIAYAKAQADAVDEVRKLVVVVTDGHPNSVALHRAGETDLRRYYRGTLIPWLSRSGIDLLAIGIGTAPSYHEHAVSISSSWHSIAIFMDLLDRLIAEGRESHAALWR
jgi:hypothetical protein